MLTTNPRHSLGTMHQQGYHMYGMVGLGIDEADARDAFQTMTETQKPMFETQLEARKKVDAVLFKEQRDQLRPLLKQSRQ